MSVASEPAPSLRRYDVVVPVKPLDGAKTRLAEVGDELRRDLVLAFLLDTLDAALGSPRVGRVAVVSHDPVVAHHLATTPATAGRVQLVPDPAPRELNRALARGLAALVDPGPTDAGVLALCADLPALTSALVTRLLDVAPTSGAGFVADRTGTGTTAYLASRPTEFTPRFGPGSRAAHAAQGAVDLSEQVPVLLRCDVDTRADLAALRDDLAPRTRALVSRDENSPLLT